MSKIGWAWAQCSRVSMGALLTSASCWAKNLIGKVQGGLT